MNRQNNTHRFPKPEIIGISLSETCLARSKCLYCDSHPNFYYYLDGKALWFNPRKILDTFKPKYVKRFCVNYYLADHPRQYHSISSFTYSVTHYTYRPRLHRARGVHPLGDSVEYLTCDCGRTQWAFSNKTIRHRPELSQRRARATHKPKFEY